jgi:sulfite exporter TauE/SafE
MPFDPAFTNSYVVAFVMGVASSLRCVSMCGSIIGTLTLSLSLDIRNKKTLILPFVFNYNMGRITSQMLACEIAGLIQSIATMQMGEYGYRLLQVLSALIMASSGLYIAGWFPRFAYIDKAGMQFGAK